MALSAWAIPFGILLHSFGELVSSAYEARLGGCDRNSHEHRDLGKLVPQHVVQKERLRFERIHLDEIRPRALDLGANAEIVFGISMRGQNGRIGSTSFNVLVSVEHAPLTPSRPKSGETDMRCDRRCPRTEAARAGKSPGRQCENDLLERGLDEIVVIALTPTEDAVDSPVDDRDEPAVEPRGDLFVARDDAFDELGIAGRRLRRRRLLSRNRSKDNARRTSGSHHYGL